MLFFTFSSSIHPTSLKNFVSIFLRPGKMSWASSPSVNKSDEQQTEDIGKYLAKLVCYHRMEPHSVCDESFTAIFHYLNPALVSSFKFETLERDCLKLYKSEQCKVKEAFSKFGGKISLLVDFLVDEKRWEQYLCLSAQFVDDDWKLQKWVIKYCGVFDMKMDLPSQAILKSLKEYDIESKVLTLTVGGTSDLADVVKENVEKHSKLPMDGHLFRVQCSCDVISRMVQKGFKEIDDIIDKVQLLSWFKSSPLWYLTSSKLSDALELHALGEFSSEQVGNFYEVPSEEEWEKARSVCRIAEKIYEITEGLFEFERPTPNVFLPYLQEIRAYLAQESASSDAFVSLVVQKMLEIFNKYWDDSCLLLSITAFLDPRYKMKFIEVCVSDMSTTTVLESIRKIYDGYDYVVQCDQKEYLLSDSSSESEEEEAEERSEQHAKKKCGNMLENLNVIKDYCQTMQPVNDEFRKLDLDLYMEEPVFPWVENFSVLHWWKENSFKYPQLSRMARDFLAIPMSVATSYDAYYTEQREADPTLSSLKPDLVNALKCTRSWKFGSKKD